MKAQNINNLIFQNENETNFIFILLDLCVVDQTETQIICRRQISVLSYSQTLVHIDIGLSVQQLLLIYSIKM